MLGSGWVPSPAATKGKCEPEEERRSQDCSSRDPLPARDGAPEANAQLHSANDTFAKDPQTA